MGNEPELRRGRKPHKKAQSIAAEVSYAVAAAAKKDAFKVRSGNIRRIGRIEHKVAKTFAEDDWEL
jgi:hypothetical protein